MFDAISSPRTGNGPAIGPLRALREIELDLHELEESEQDEVAEIISRCAECCPLLEVWRGTLPGGFHINVELLGDLFGLFVRLKVIYLHEDNILGPNCQRTGYETEEDSDDEQEGQEEGPENEVGEAEEIEKTADETVTKDNACDDSVIEACVNTIALSCEALQNVSIRRRYPLTDWWTISRTRNPAVGSVFSLNRRTIEEHDLEMTWTSLCVLFTFFLFSCGNSG
jgi:hypothetical protein